MVLYAMVGGKIVDHSLSLERIGITSNCTVSFFSRLRGGSRDNVPGQWTCSFCFAERCWPVRVKCYRCGNPRQADPILFNDKKGKGPKGPLGRAPPKGPSSVLPTTSSRPHVVPQRGGPPRGMEWEIFLPLLLRLALSLLKTWSRHSCSSRMS